MKKKLFRSLENLLGKKMVVLPFLGLLAASAVLVWTTAFAPGNRRTSGEENPAGGGSAEEGENSSEPITSPEVIAKGEVRGEGTVTHAEHGQCKAITKKGTRCQHMADESGYCRQHRALFEQQVPA